MISVLVKHISEGGKILPTRAAGSPAGGLKPIRFYYPMQFTYVVHPNNGEADFHSQSVFPNGKYEALSITPSWTGHRFLGWFTEANVPSRSTETAGIKKTALDSVTWDVTDIYANWQLPANITFDAATNGGSMPAWSRDYYATQAYGSLPPVNSRQHHYYEGWFTNAAGGVKVTTSTIVPTDAVLYAQWTAAVAITFDAETNGGNVESGWTPPDYYPGHRYNSIPGVEYREHHLWEGWFTQPAGGERIDEYSIVPSAPTTLYSQWTAAVNVVFDATAGGGEMPADWNAPDYYPGYEYGELPHPTHTTLSFVGWYDQGGNRVTESDIVPDGGATLVAQYASRSYSVELGNDWLSPSNASSETVMEGGWNWNEETQQDEWVPGEAVPYTPPPNPDSTIYDGVYESVQGRFYELMQQQGGYTCWMKIHAVGYSEFTVYIRSNAESDYDFMVALNEDVNPSETYLNNNGHYLSDVFGYSLGPSNGDSEIMQYIKVATQGNQNSGTNISDYTEVTYHLDGGEHDIWLGFTKDGSVSDGDDRGYVLIPRSGGSGGNETNEITPVEYLEANGNKYFDTGITFDSTQDYSIQVTAENLDNDRKVLVGNFGSGDACVSLEFGGTGNGMVNKPRAYIQSENSGTSTSIFGSELSQNTSYDIELNYVKQSGSSANLQLLVNGTVVTSSNATCTGISSSTLKVFRDNRGSVLGGSCRIYSIRITCGSTVIFDAVPVRIGQVGYLYDSVSGQTIDSLGNGTVTVGPDIS